MMLSQGYTGLSTRHTSLLSICRGEGVCVFITAGPITKLFAGGGGGESYHRTSGNDAETVSSNGNCQWKLTVGNSSLMYITDSFSKALQVFENPSLG